MFRPLSIVAVLNGWIVTVGCQTVVYTSRELLLADLNTYMQFPRETEERFLHHAVNRAHTMGPAAATATRDRAAEPWQWLDPRDPPKSRQ